MFSPVEGTALALLAIPTASPPLRSVHIENTNLNPSVRNPSSSSVSSSSSASSSTTSSSPVDHREFILSLALDQIIQQDKVQHKQHIIILRSKDDIQNTEDDALFIVAATGNQCIVYQIEYTNAISSASTLRFLSSLSTSSSTTVSTTSFPTNTASSVTATVPPKNSLYTLKIVRNFYVGNDIVMLLPIDGTNGAFVLATGTTVHQYVLLRSSSTGNDNGIHSLSESNSSSHTANESLQPVYTYDICHTGIWTTPPDVLSSGRITGIRASTDARYISVSCGDCLVILYHELTLPSYAYVPLVDTLHHSINSISNNNNLTNNSNTMNTSTNLLGSIFRGRANSSSSINSNNSSSITNVPKLVSIILQHEDTIQHMEWKTDPVVVSSTEIAIAVGSGRTKKFSSPQHSSSKASVTEPNPTTVTTYNGGFIGSLTWASHTNRSPYPLPYGISTSPALLLITTKNGNSFLWRENDPWNSVNFTQIVTFLPPSPHLHSTANSDSSHSHSTSSHSLLHTSSLASTNRSEANTVTVPSPKITINWTWMRQVIGHDRVHWAWTDAIKPNLSPDIVHINHMLSSSVDKNTIGRNRSGSTGTTTLGTFHPTLSHSRSRMLNRTLSIIGLFSSNKDLHGSNTKSTQDDNNSVDISSVFIPPLPHIHNHYAPDNPLSSIHKDTTTSPSVQSSVPVTHITPLPRTRLMNSTIKEERTLKSGEILDEQDEDEENETNDVTKNSISKELELSFRGRSDTIEYTPRFIWPNCGHDFHLSGPSGTLASSSINTSPNTSGRYTADGVVRTATSSSGNNNTEPTKNPLVRRSNDALLGIMNELPSRASTLDSEYIVSCQTTLHDRSSVLPKEPSQRSIQHSTGSTTEHTGVKIGLHRIHGVMEGFESDVHVSEVSICHFSMHELHGRIAEHIHEETNTIAYDILQPLLQTTSVTMYHATSIHDARVAGSVAPSLAPAFSTVRHFDRSAADAFRLLGNTIDSVNSTNTTLIPSESVMTDLASVASTVTSATIEAPKFRTRVASAMATAAVCDAIDTMVDAMDLYDGRSNTYHARDTEGTGNNRKSTVLHQSEQKRSLPIRKVRRSINRGLNIRNRINHMPQVSYITLLVQGNLLKANTESIEPYTIWNALVELTIEWGTSHTTHSVVTRYHILKFLPQCELKTTDFIPSSIPNSGTKDTGTVLPAAWVLPEIPTYHPSFIKVTLEQGRMDIVSRSFAHVAWCLRRALTWQETAKYVIQKAKKEENPDDHSEMWANLIAESLSTEKDLTKEENNDSRTDSNETEAIDNDDNIRLANGSLSGSSSLFVSVPELPLSLLFASATKAFPYDTTTMIKLMEIKPLRNESLRRLRLWYSLNPFTIQLVPSSNRTYPDSYPPPLSVNDIDLLREYLPLASTCIGNLTPNEQTNFRILLEAYVTTNGPNLSASVNSSSLSSSVNGENKVSVPLSSSTMGSANCTTSASVDPAGKVTLVSAVIMEAGRKLLSTNSPHTPLPPGMSNSVTGSDNLSSNLAPTSMVDNGMESLPWSACVTALISDSQDALVRTLLPPEVGVTWHDLAALKIPLWLRSDRELADIIERIGKTAFLVAGKDPYATVLPYLSLGISKVSLVRNFFRLSSTHGKVYTFLSNDFTQDRWKQAASKNAFALLAAHKYEAAAGFFLLAGKPGQAVRVLVQQRREPFMALTVARLALFNGSVSIPPVTVPATNTNNAESSVLTTITVASASTAYGGYDAAQILKDATAELLAEARVKQQHQAVINNTSMTVASSSVAVGFDTSKTIPTKSILGFGFDDDNDYIAPSSVSSVKFVDGLPVRTSTDDDTVYRPSTVTSSVNTTTATPPSSVTATGSSFNGNLRTSSRPDADVDPIGWVIDSEFKCLAEGKSTYACEENGKVNSVTNSAVSVLNKDSTKALEFILLWLTKKPMDAMTELLSFIGENRKSMTETTTDHADYRLPVSAALLLDMPVWKRPQILKVLLSRLRKRLPINQTLSDDNAYLLSLKAQLISQEIFSVGMEGGRTGILSSPALPRMLTNSVILIDPKTWITSQGLMNNLLVTLDSRISALLDSSISIERTRESIHHSLQIFWDDTAVLSSICTVGKPLIDKTQEISLWIELSREKCLWFASIALMYEQILNKENNSPLVNLFTVIIDRIFRESNELIQETASYRSADEFLDEGRWTNDSKLQEDKHIVHTLQCLRVAKLLALCFETVNIVTSKKSILYTHAWVHLVFMAYGRHDWEQLTDLLRQGSGSYKGRKLSTMTTPYLSVGSVFMVPSFASTLYHNYWLHSWGLKLSTVRSNGYFFIAGTLRSPALPFVSHPSNRTTLTIKINSSSSSTGNYGSTSSGDTTASKSAILHSQQIISLEKWLTRYIAAAAGALLTLQIQNVLYDSARESLPLLDSWYQRCAVVVTAAHSTVQMMTDALPFDTDGKLDLNRSFMWGENNGPRAHIITGLTGIPDTRTAMIAHGFDWEATQQAKEIANAAVNSTNNRRKGGNSGSVSNAVGGTISNAGVRRPDSGVKSTTAHDPSRIIGAANENSSAWWADVSALFSTYSPSTIKNSEYVGSPLLTLWKYLGGPGLLWMIGTERRALVRARTRSRSGFLPSVRSTDKIEIRGKSSLPVLQFSIFTPSGSLAEFSANASMTSTSSPSYIRAGISGAGRFILVAVEGTSMNTVVVGVGRLNNHMDPFQIIPLSTGSNKIPVSMVPHPMRLLNGNGNSLGGMLSTLPSSGSFTNLHHLTNNVTGSHVKQLLSGSLVRRGSSNLMTGNQGGHSTETTATENSLPHGAVHDSAMVTTTGATGSESTHGLSLLSRVKNFRFLGGKKSVSSHTHAAGSVTPTVPSGQVIVPVVLRQNSLAEDGSIQHQDFLDPLHRENSTGNSSSSSFQISVAPLPDSLLHTDSVGGNNPVAHTMEALVPHPSTKVPPIPPPTAVTLTLDTNNSNSSGGHLPSSPPQFNTSTLPTAVWWRDQHEYALPFTLPPSSFDMHPTAPLYLRGGPKGTVAAISVTLEQPELIPEGATNDHTWLQYVHRLHSLYSYEPINTSSNHNPPNNNPSHSHHSLASSFFSSSRSSFTNLSSLSNGSTPRDETATPWDEQILRVRWSPDGRNTIASFASGIVRTWDITSPDHPTAAMVLPTIEALHNSPPVVGMNDTGSSKFTKSKLNPELREYESLSTWAATDFLCLSASARVLAVAGAPTSALDKYSLTGSPVTTRTSSSAAQTSKIGHAPVGFEAGGMLHVTPVVLQDTIIGGTLFNTGTHSSSTTGGTNTVPNITEFPQLAGYGINLFDLRVGNSPYATVAPYPDFAGINVLCFDEASLSLIGGCTDGSLLVYDIRTSTLRAKVPGVPIIPVVPTDKPPRTNSNSFGVPTPLNDKLVAVNDKDNLLMINSKQLARGMSYFSMVDNNMDTLKGNSLSPGDSSTGTGSIGNNTNIGMDMNYGFGHAGGITVITMHPTHRILLTGGEDGDIHLWSLPDLLHRATLPHIHTPKSAMDNHTGGSKHKNKPSTITNDIVIHTNDNLDYAKTNTTGKASSNFSSVSPQNEPKRAGISSIAVTEEHIISAGYDGSIYAIPQRW